MREALNYMGGALPDLTEEEEEEAKEWLLERARKGNAESEAERSGPATQDRDKERAPAGGDEYED